MRGCVSTVVGGVDAACAHLSSPSRSRRLGRLIVIVVGRWGRRRQRRSAVRSTRRPTHLSAGPSRWLMIGDERVVATGRSARPRKKPTRSFKMRSPFAIPALSRRKRFSSANFGRGPGPCADRPRLCHHRPRGQHHAGAGDLTDLPRIVLTRISATIRTTRSRSSAVPPSMNHRRGPILSRTGVSGHAGAVPDLRPALLHSDLAPVHSRPIGAAVHDHQCRTSTVRNHLSPGQVNKVWLIAARSLDQVRTEIPCT